MKIRFFASFLACSFFLHGQFKPTEVEFSPPLDIPLILAGTFGELRSNHFHAGLDIKTQQREGLPVYAIAEGVVSRIKVDHWGYGKVVYIQHPGGYTSVYGHLQKFGPNIENYVKNMQYQNQSYQIEAFPKFGELVVNQGDVIAFSGNTGGSSGPHLHFEVRDSRNENPTNPLLYNFEIKDKTSPTLESLFVYPLSDGAVVNKSELRIEIPLSRQPDGSYLAQPINAIGTIGFGVSAYDRHDLAANKNGLFQIVQRVNGSTITEITFDRFSFDESRQLNTLIDYPYLTRYGKRIQKCFRDSGNRLSLFKANENDGKINVETGMSYSAEIELADRSGNRTLVRIPILGKEESPGVVKDVITTPYLVRSDQPSSFNLDKAIVYFPAGAFYQNAYLDLAAQGDTVVLHEPTLPLERNFTLTFSIADLQESAREGLCIVRLNDRNTPIFYETYRRAQSVSIRSRELGRYTTKQDTVPPKIRPKNFKAKQWLNHYRYLSVIIEDELSGIDTYKAYLNGKWILMEYEPKKRTLTYAFDEVATNGPQFDLKVEVTDVAGNSSTFETTFFRQ